MSHYKKYLKSRKHRGSKHSPKRRGSKHSRKRRGSKHSRKRRNYGFGFKYLRNDQIINSVFHDNPNNLTCGRS